MGRKSQHNLPPGIQLDQHGIYWATLEGEDAKLWKARYPGTSLPRRKATTIKQALKFQRQLVNDLKANRDPNADNPKVSDWVRTCIDRKRDLAPGTALRYRSSLKWQIEPHRIGRLRLLQVTDTQVNEWIDVLIAQKHQRNDDRTLDPYSIRNAFALLRLAFNMAIPKLVTINPCKGVKLPLPDDEEIRPLDPEQVDIFLTYLDTLIHDKATNKQQPHRNAALYHVAIRCGLREGELIGLRWSDIDLKRHELRVAGQIQKGTRRKTKSGDRGRRTIPLSHDLVRVLEWHKRNQIEERAIGSENWNAADLVFCSDAGTPINPSNLNYQFDRFLRQAELPDLRFHHLRHTYAALNIAAGMDLYTLSRRMGHSTITITADKYGHLYQGHSQDADALDRLLKRSA
jgi:integrase